MPNKHALVFYNQIQNLGGGGWGGCILHLKKTANPPGRILHLKMTVGRIVPDLSLKMTANPPGRILHLKMTVGRIVPDLSLKMTANPLGRILPDLSLKLTASTMQSPYLPWTRPARRGPGGSGAPLEEGRLV